jgi:hypothetical protein
MKDNCERCEKKLNNSNTVWLELSNTDGLYYEKIPKDHVSQGAFPFGSTCAKIELMETERKNKEKNSESLTSKQRKLRLFTYKVLPWTETLPMRIKLTDELFQVSVTISTTDIDKRFDDYLFDWFEEKGIEIVHTAEIKGLRTYLTTNLSTSIK